MQRNAQSVCVLNKYRFPNLNILNLWLFTSFSKQRVAATVTFTGATNRQCVATGCMESAAKLLFHLVCLNVSCSHLGSRQII